MKYVMVDPGNYTEEITADSDDDAIRQLEQWAEVDGYPYTGIFCLNEVDDDGDYVRSVHQHESCREADD